MPKGKKQEAMDHEQHMKLQRDKELKRKERRDTQLPAEYKKGKKERATRLPRRDKP